MRQKEERSLATWISYFFVARTMVNFKCLTERSLIFHFPLVIIGFRHGKCNFFFGFFQSLFPDCRLNGPKGGNARFFKVSGWPRASRGLGLDPAPESFWRHRNSNPCGR
jgi:hypothetical protein